MEIEQQERESRKNIQWFPGHMAKTIRLLKQEMSVVDVVIEMLDARIPQSSRNPILDEVAKGKKRIFVLNKADLADDRATEQWAHYLRQDGVAVVRANAKSGAGIKDIEKAARALTMEKVKAQKAKGRLIVPIRAACVGIPNTGKSTLINRYKGATVAKTEDRPGVTRNRRWIKVKDDFDILDTPGVVWGKFEDSDVGLKIFLTGGLPADENQIHGLCAEGVTLIEALYPGRIGTKYKTNDETKQMNADAVIESVARAKGLIMKGERPDTFRAAVMIIEDIRSGKLGKMTLDVRSNTSLTDN